MPAPIKISKRRMPRNTPLDDHIWEALIPNFTINLGIEVKASTLSDAKRLIKEAAQREWGYRDLKFTR